VAVEPACPPGLPTPVGVAQIDGLSDDCCLPQAPSASRQDQEEHKADVGIFSKPL